MALPLKRRSRYRSTLYHIDLIMHDCLSEMCVSCQNINYHYSYNYRDFYYISDRNNSGTTITILSNERYNYTLMALSSNDFLGIIDTTTADYNEEGFRFMTDMKYNINKVIDTPLVKELERKMISYCSNKIKTTFGVTLDIDYGVDNDYRRFLGWLKKHDKSFRNHTTKIPFKPYYVLKDADFIIKVGKRTYARILTGDSLKNSLNELEKRDNALLAATGSVTNVRLYIFGKEAKKVAYNLDKIRKHDHLEFFTVSISSESRLKNNITIYRDFAVGRNKDSVFLNDNTKDIILDHISKFFANKEVYSKRNLNYKTGILLEGEPGTGKSTIASMVATEFNCSMVIINMNQFSQLDTDFITSTLNADDKTYVVLLEDIDCVIGDRESEDSDVENKKNVNKLLQFLDSASSPSNVIFIATTNHIEKLDDAIVRDGRFDLKVNISNINRITATQMCKSFGIKDGDTIQRIFDENSVNGKINPAKLQNLILKEIDN